MKILFQGDSITDANRERGNDDSLGWGYARLIKSTLTYEEPCKYEFINRGISGNRIVDLYARLKSDIINLNPDVMSILIGVNDVWHEYDFSDKPNGVDAEKYFKIYSMLIEEVKQALPDIKIMIMEPFTLEGTGNFEYYPLFKKEVTKRAEKAKAIAEKYGFPFIELQDKFNEAAKLAPNSNWLRDGVHPTEAGYELIKREWIKCFKNIITEGNEDNVTV